MKLKENMILTELGDEYVAVPITSGEGFRGVVRLNETGMEIWKAIEAGMSVEQIADKLMEDYEGVDRPRALAAVKKIVDQLLAEGLLEE